MISLQTSTVCCLHLSSFYIVFFFKGGKSIWIRKTGSLLNFRNLDIFEKFNKVWEVVLLLMQNLFHGQHIQKLEEPRGMCWMGTSQQHILLHRVPYTSAAYNDSWAKFGSLSSSMTFLQGSSKRCQFQKAYSQRCSGQ